MYYDIRETVHSHRLEVLFELDRLYAYFQYCDTGESVSTTFAFQGVW